MSQLLVEALSPAEAGIIVENSTDNKNMWLSGIMMMAEKKNRNGRVYGLNEISMAVQSLNQKIQETRGVMGELDHPQTLSINLDRVSHVITECRMEGTNAVGKMKLLNTPMGLIAQELARSGVAIGVSSRGAGSVNESGQVSGFNVITVDIVATPSAQNAYPNTVYEALEHSKNGQKIVTLAEQVQHDAAAQEYFKREIIKWLSDTSMFKRK